MKNKITDKERYEAILSSLSKEDIQRREESIAEGYEDEQCPKCGRILLAFHHFLRCPYAKCGNCPMVTNTKSVLDMMLEDCNKEDKNE